MKTRILITASFLFMLATNALSTQADSSVPVPGCITWIRQGAATAADYVPEGWREELTLTGDLDGDDIDDLVLVLQATDPARVRRAESASGTETFDNNPRMIVILAGRSDGHYVPLECSTRFIPPADQPIIADPLAIIRLGGATLEISLQYFASMGSWTTMSQISEFAHDGTCMRLRRQRKSVTHRASGEFEQTHSDFDARVRRRTVGHNARDDDRTQTSILDQPAPCLHRITPPW